MKLASLDDLLAEIGLGNAMSVVVAKNLQQGEAAAAPVPANASNHGHLPIKGADGVLITFAKCCRPIPVTRLSPTSVRVKGWLSTMNPVVTFAATRKSRRNLWRLSGIKRPLRSSSPKSRWTCLTTEGALANLTAAINTASSNIQSLNTEEKDGRVYSAFIRLTARDRVHLANIMRKIRIMPDVIKVTRNRN